MGCPDNSFKYLSSEANARETLVKEGAIDEYDKIIDKNKFKEQAKRFLDYVKKDFNLDVVSVITGRNMITQFNRDVFSKVDKARGYDKINTANINAQLKGLDSKTKGLLAEEINQVKPGVQELFDSNPELANSVYEALVPNGYTRLYRSEDDNSQDTSAPDWVKESEEYKAGEDAKGRWFYKTLNEAVKHSEKFGTKGITYVDILNNQVDSFNAKENKFAGGYGREGNEYFVSKELANNRKFFEQQKQQAQQLYSQYLDSVFPDSQVKDIVYHGTPFEFDSFKKPLDIKENIFNQHTLVKEEDNPHAIYFQFEPKSFRKGKVVPAIVNSKELIKKENYSGYSISYATGNRQKLEEQLNSKTFDALDITPLQGKRELLVFEPEQIHVLGSKQDIKGFKTFMKNPIKSSVKYNSLSKDFNIDNLANDLGLEKKCN